MSPYMTRLETAAVLSSLRVGEHFRIWFMHASIWQQETRDGETVLFDRDIEIDGEEAKACLGQYHLDYQVVRAPNPRTHVGEVVLLRTGSRDSFVFTPTGIRAVKRI